MTALSPRQVAKRWNCSERSIRRLIGKGDLPAFRICSLLRIRVEDVESYESGGQCGSLSTEGDGTPPSRPRTESTDKLSERLTVVRLRDAWPRNQHETEG